MVKSVYLASIGCSSSDAAWDTQTLHESVWTQLFILLLIQLQLPCTLGGSTLGDMHPGRYAPWEAATGGLSTWVPANHVKGLD